MSAAIILTTVLGLLAGFQLALACGAPLGAFAWGGQHRVLPRRLRIGSVANIGVYGSIAVVMLDRAGAVSVFPDGYSDAVAWVIVGFFGVGMMGNVVSRSRPERLVMVPMNILLLALSLVVAVG